VWTDCDSVWLICIKGRFYVENELLCFRVALVWTDCDSEWLVGINIWFYYEQELLCFRLALSGQIVIVSG
jgi:hypothetical protein